MILSVRWVTHTGTHGAALYRALSAYSTATINVCRALPAHSAQPTLRCVVQRSYRRWCGSGKRNMVAKHKVAMPLLPASR